jgi:hypothetical protein
MKFPVRITALAASVALAAAVGGAGAASAETSGVGTASVETNLLDVSVSGGLVGLKVVSDQGSSNVDPSAGTSQAISRLVPVALSSNSISAINTINGALSPVNQQFVSQSPGGNPSVGTPAVNFATPATGIALPLNLLSGQLNAGSLTTAFDAVKGAASALNFSLTNLKVAGGLLTADTFGDVNGSAANSGVTDGSRTVDIGTIKALNLGALLQGLGINPGGLPVNDVLALVDKLGLPISGLPTGATNLTSGFTILNSLATSTQAQINSLTSSLSSGTSSVPVPSGLTATISGLTTVLPGTGLTAPSTSSLSVPDTQTLITQLTSALTQAQQLLAGLLSQGLNGLLNTSLLELDGAQLGVVTKAAPALADSVAGITAQLGAIKVAGLNLPGLDLSSTLSTVSNVVNQANGALSSLLGTLSPSLANLVHVSVLDQNKSVTSSGGYNRAVAGITAVSAVIDPSAILGGLSGLVGSLTGASVHSADVSGTSGIVSAITSLGGSLPVISNLVPGLTSALGVANLLGAGPTSIKVGEMLSGATYAASSTTPAVAPPAAAPKLPRTGAHTTEWAALAAILFALALGVRRVVRRPALD